MDNNYCELSVFGKIILKGFSNNWLINFKVILFSSKIKLFPFRGGLSVLHCDPGSVGAACLSSRAETELSQSDLSEKLNIRKILQHHTLPVDSWRKLPMALISNQTHNWCAYAYHQETNKNSSKESDVMMTFDPVKQWLDWDSYWE